MDKIVCVGKNYAEHAKELGDAVPEKPVLFLKPPSVLVTCAKWGEEVLAPLPRDRGAVHHECEIVLRLKVGGSHLSEAAARAAIGEVTLGLDMTLRDLQAGLKKAGHPWTTSKVFPASAVIGPWISLSSFPNYLEEPFSFSVGGKTRQLGLGTQMSFDPVKILQYVSQNFDLWPGDLIFTGTPAGVGPVNAQDIGELRWGSRAYSVRWT